MERRYTFYTGESGLKNCPHSYTCPAAKPTCPAFLYDNVTFTSRSYDLSKNRVA